MGFLAGGFMYLMHPRLHSVEEKMSICVYISASPMIEKGSVGSGNEVAVWLYIPPDEAWTCWEE